MRGDAAQPSIVRSVWRTLTICRVDSGRVVAPGRPLAVVRCAKRKGFASRANYTAPVGDGEPGQLEAETFRARLPKARRIVIDAMPDGEYRVTEITAREQRPVAGSRAAPELPPFPEPIRPTDVVAVCILLVRCFGDPTK